jgi:predicted nucleotidyltransferase
MWHSASGNEPVTLPPLVRDDLRRYIESLERQFGDRLVSVVLFGSHARGKGRPGSDLDLLLVVEGLPRRRFERYRGVRALAREVSDAFAEAAAPILLTPGEARQVKPYYLGMLSGHVMLRDAGGFFASVLDRLQRRLTELGARRHVDRDGYEYWDLKPDWKPGDVVTL